ncbi:syndetin-like isoform X2 [Tigriopus californicus]|uniref:syndetin-like isoform X2 n=1 Tax=Tigriopus californicus TaxID=6832 RepID=UPI0027D9FEF4|nr:syndetin-like isoform X2 [Tigriopus californicus]
MTSNVEAGNISIDEKVDDEVLEEIPPEFFEANFDATSFELKRLSQSLDLQQIQSDRQKIHRQLSVVTQRVFAGILEKQSKCQAEMTNIDKIHGQLAESLKVCVQGRHGLSQARAEFTGSSLGVLAAYRRRQQTQQLLNDLNIIRTLQKTDVRLQELLKEDNFPGAIQLLLECQQVVSTYSHFQAVKQLAVKLQDTLDLTEEHLDVALSKVCVGFNPLMYERIHQAYCLLGKTQISMDQLHMHLTSTIHNMAWNVVYGHAMLSQEANMSLDLSKRPYADLCDSIATSSVIPCLVDLCRALWSIMNSYKQLVDWHETNPTPSNASEMEQHYVEKKLSTGKMRIWQDVQTKTKIFVLANDLSSLGMDHFLEFMDVIHRLIQVGHDFCGSNSDTLQESLKTQCWNYFHNYHLSRLEEMTMHFENEGWAQCPVKPSFKVQQLVEYRHLKILEFTGLPTNLTSIKPMTSTPAATPRKAFRNKVQDLNLDLSLSSPFDFDFGGSHDPEETFFLEANGIGGDELEVYSEEDDSDAEIDEALKRDFVDEGTGEMGNHDHSKRTSNRTSQRKGHDPPILTNTSLMILRLCGKYIHLMKALEPIASNVFISMMQLLEYYLFVVFNFFTKDLSSDLMAKLTHEGLNAILERIDTDMVRRVVDKPPQTPIMSPSPSNQSLSESQVVTGIVDLPELSPTVQMDQPESLFGLQEKLVAVESAVYLAKQIQSLKGDILQCVTNDQRSLVDTYESQTLMNVVGLRLPVYMTSVQMAINTDVILQLMAKVAWDIKDVKSQHSQYVEVLLRDCQMFSLRLQEIRKNVHVSGDVRKALWELCTLCASKIFVEGFSSAKKCSNEGRALMQLDYRQFLLKLENLSDLKPLPYQDYVSNYVKAYYIPESDLEAWVKQHNNEYTPKQMVALVNCVAYSNNRTKQKLNNMISDLGTRIRRDKH